MSPAAVHTRLLLLLQNCPALPNNPQIASKALYDFSNQYPSLLGIPELRQAVARHSAAQQGIECDWSTDTLITVGATEGIAAAFMGLVNPGDEVSPGGW